MVFNFNHYIHKYLQSLGSFLSNQVCTINSKAKHGNFIKIKVSPHIDLLHLQKLFRADFPLWLFPGTLSHVLFPHLFACLLQEEKFCGGKNEVNLLEILKQTSKLLYGVLPKVFLGLNSETKLHVSILSNFTSWHGGSFQFIYRRCCG